MAALCYAAFAFLKIPIPTPGGGMVALHIGNAFCVLAALYLGGVYGGLAGAIGMTIADLMDPKYVTSAPKTFLLKFCIGLIAGFIAHKLGHITEDHDRKDLFFWTLLASAVALGFNVIADPIVGYLYKTYLLGIPQEASKIMATWAAGVTAINSVAGTVVVVIAYAALRDSSSTWGKSLRCFETMHRGVKTERCCTVLRAAAYCRSFFLIVKRGKTGYTR